VRVAAAAAVVALLLAGGPAAAAIPSATKITQAVAEANEVSGRAEPLLLEVSLRIGDAPPSAQGELATHPTGLARLELRNHLGFVERHLLQGDDYRASRDGQLLDHPHPFLPPVFLLQAESGAALAAALTSFGIAGQQVVLGRLGDHDCYVLGGRDIPTDREPEHLLPSLWVDIESYDPVRIVRSDGVVYLLGPVGVFDGIRLPRWIEIQAPDSPPARLEVRSAAKANAPAAAFGTDWLLAPPAEMSP
jgi:hypothetical protein